MLKLRGVDSRVAPAAALLVALAAGLSASPASQAGEGDLDRFMARVLERRDEAWRKLHDYILTERESFRLLGPGDVPLHGLRREYSWYVREGYLVRSPIRFDGVTLNEEERRAYEEKWLREEKDREKRARDREEKGGQRTERTETEVRLSPGGVKVTQRSKTDGVEQDPEPESSASRDDESPIQNFMDSRGEPRFISEAYFLRFKFEPGNYYIAGRESLDGRDVLRIEYYPSRLFGPDEEGSGRNAESTREAGEGTRQRRGSGGRDADSDIDRQLNKVSLVTLWVDPEEHQIVRYTFENVDFGFLPGRWLVRADQARASMTMARVLDGVWLPARITMGASLSLASGGYRFTYEREFFDYKKAEVGARIRSYVPKEP